MALTLGSFVSQLTRTEGPRGPAPAYTPTHIIRLLLILDAEQTMGRISLSKRLGIGEGSVRTMIKKLVEMSIISVDAVGGCHLTDLGRSIVGDLKGVIVASSSVDLNEMGISLPSKAIQVRGLVIPDTSFTRLRDIGVRNGAEGMMIFVFRGDCIRLPMMTEAVDKEYPKISRGIKSSFKLKEGDAVLVAFSEDANLAEQGAFSAVLSLIA